MAVGHAGVLGASVPRLVDTDINIAKDTAITQRRDMEGSLVLEHTLKRAGVL